MKILLKGGRVIDPASKTDNVLDIFIEDGRITEIGEALTPKNVDTTIEIPKGHWVTPGLVDVHVHFRDPGRPDKETTATGSRAAIAGGFTSVCTMPNTDPTIDTLPTLEYLMRTAKEEAVVKIYPFGAITRNLEGDVLTDMGMLHQHGAVGFTDDGCCVAKGDRMRRALEYASMFNLPLMCHAEDMNLSAHGVMNEGIYATRMGVPGIPNAAESVIVARDIELSRLTGGHVHFTHLSTREAVAMVREAKAQGLNVTADTTPHHLALTDKDVADSGYDPDFKMNPPLRSEADRLALIEGLKDGTIDAIATDHAPHTPDEKLLALDHAPCGVVGLETAVGVILTTLFHTGQLKEKDIVRLMSTRPAEVMHLPAGRLAVGEAADITVIDPNQAWTVDPLQFRSRSRNSPFKGKTLTGRATTVLVEGQVVLQDGQLVGHELIVCVG